MVQTIGNMFLTYFTIIMLSCMDTNKTNVMVSKKFPSIGMYSGFPEKYVGILQLEVFDSNKVIFHNLITLHLPPVEIEKIEGELVKGKQGEFCIKPAPNTIEACFKLLEDGSLLVVEKNSEDTIVLKRVE